MDTRRLMDLLSSFVSMVYGLRFSQNDVFPAVINAWERVRESVAPKPIRAESPNCQYMMQRDQQAKDTFDTFVLRIREHHDLQRRPQITQHADSSPRPIVAALNPRSRPPDLPLLHGK